MRLCFGSGGFKTKGSTNGTKGGSQGKGQAVSDDEEEEEFQDSREDQFDQILISNLNPPPASDLGQPDPIPMGHPGTSVQGGNQAVGW